MFSLYTLNEPVGSRIRYVGISKDVESRFSRHKSNKRSDNPHKKNWIAKLAREGTYPTCQTLITGMSFEDACKYEIEMIRTLRESGYDLTNISLGGEGTPGVRRSEESRKKQSERQKGRKHSLEARKKIGDSKRGKKRPLEFCRKMSEVKMGVGRGRVVSLETRRKLSEVNRGKTLSLETRRKLSEINRGKVPSLETRKKMSDAGRGRIFSLEHRRKLGEANRRRAEKRKAGI